MTIDQRMSYLDQVRNFLAIVVSPLYLLLDAPVDGFTSISNALVEHSQLLKHNSALKKANLQLRGRLQRFNDLERENQRLRTLLQSSKKFGEQILIAEIMAVDLDPFSRRMVINRGAFDNLVENLPLIDAFGVMGQIIEVGYYSSSAMLITDPEHAIPVQIERTDLHTVASGTGESDRLELLYLPNTADIRVGDKLITSGMGGIFPKGYPVAEVTEVKRDIGQSYINANARPTAKLDRNRDVLVVWENKDIDGIEADSDKTVADETKENTDVDDNTDKNRQKTP
jgi:rod shape-determining protein MreC